MQDLKNAPKFYTLQRRKYHDQVRYGYLYHPSKDLIKNNKKQFARLLTSFNLLKLSLEEEKLVPTLKTSYTLDVIQDILQDMIADIEPILQIRTMMEKV